MADFYNITNLSNASDVIDWLTFIQFDVDVPISELILLAVFGVSFLSLKRFDNMKAWMGSMFIVTITAFLFRTANLLHQEWFTIAVTLTVATILGVWFFYED